MVDPRKLKVAELRNELKSRGLNTEGLKSALVERLEVALRDSEVQIESVIEKTETHDTPEPIMVKGKPSKSTKNDGNTDSSPSSKKKSPKKKSSTETDFVESTEAPTSAEHALTAHNNDAAEERNDKSTSENQQDEPTEALSPSKKTKRKSTSSSSTSEPVLVPPPPPPAPAIELDPLMKLASEYWPNLQSAKFNAKIVEEVYEEDIIGNGSNHSKKSYGETMSMLESTSYLEFYLWPHFDQDSTLPHMFSIATLVNAKVVEGVPAFQFLKQSSDNGSDKFALLFAKLSRLSMEQELWDALRWREKSNFLLFLTNIFSSCFEENMVSSVVMKVVSLPTWLKLSDNRLQQEFEEFPLLKRHWQHLLAKKAEDEESSGSDMESFLIPSLISNFLNSIDNTDATDAGRDYVRYLERFLELATDLLSQLHTRRFLRTLFDDQHILERTSLSAVAKLGNMPQLLEKFKFYLGFEIQDQTGEALSDSQVMTKHLQRVHILQRIAFKYYSDSPFKNFAFLSTSAVGQRAELSKHLGGLSDEALHDIAVKAKIIADDATDLSRELVLEILLNAFSERDSQVMKISELPLYPDELALWENSETEDEEKGLSVPMGSYKGDQALALPKLNLQFLTFQDYLLRAFQLFRLEAAYEIRADITDTVTRLIPRTDPFGACYFSGWARMGCKVDGLSVSEVSKPNLGEKVPAFVSAEIVVNLTAFKNDIREEWEELREHDVLFLVSVSPPPSDDDEEEGGKRKRQEQKNNKNRRDDWADALALKNKLGIQAVRGCEVFGLLDEEGVELNDPLKPDPRKQGRKGDIRTIKVRLDPAQYHSDMRNGIDVYSANTLNILVRRRGKENNFKAVLETIRDLMNTAAVGQAVPSWLHDLFLGYGDPGAAHYKALQKAAADEDEVESSMDFRDTFLNVAHVKSSFPDAAVQVSEECGAPPYRLTFSSGEDAKEVVEVTSYSAPNPGPYPQDQPKVNSVEFTPVQTEAIRSGMSKGLTMVVGPPGTGKTDVAVQIIANLYHNHPNEKTLIVTHSNSALNDLFCKIMERDVLERHLLRLGSGVEKLAEFTEGRDFSKFGRVNFTLSRRQDLLSQVQRLADSLKIDSGDVGYTCEGAAFFHLYHVTSRVEKFEQAVKESQGERGSVQRLFPFRDFFSDAPAGKMWCGTTEAEDLDCALGCFRHLEKVFGELSDFRAFELLRNHRMRSNYLLLKQARIVAMTCTHAAITRKQLVELGFRYDNLIMEEAAQVLEVETVIPMMLQQANDKVLGQGSLQRVCLIGDHHQLPPVVKNLMLQKYSKLDQTLFTRFIRLGVPHVLLNQQGRSRPEMARLYSWRYGDLGDLPCVAPQGSTAFSFYSAANVGFAHTFQFVDVPDFLGRGESTPTPFFYQNLGEAEFVVATYQYMRLIGYPAERISIITTYNGQKELIRDVLKQRCSHPFYGQPARVTTVDKYQGQQNDYILLSLVRTHAVGHLRDVRRLVVALSRARLGLYIFGRLSLFRQCQELSPSFDLLLQKPTQLQLVLGEQWPYTLRRPTDSLEGVVSGDNEAAVHELETKNAITELGTIVHSMHSIATKLEDKSLPTEEQDQSAMDES